MSLVLLMYVHDVHDVTINKIILRFIFVVWLFLKVAYYIKFNVFYNLEKNNLAVVNHIPRINYIKYWHSLRYLASGVRWPFSRIRESKTKLLFLIFDIFFNHFSYIYIYIELSFSNGLFVSIFFYFQRLVTSVT
jgi:hypothetical protein